MSAAECACIMKSTLLSLSLCLSFFLSLSVSACFLPVYFSFVIVSCPHCICLDLSTCLSCSAFSNIPNSVTLSVSLSFSFVFFLPRFPSDAFFPFLFSPPPLLSVLSAYPPPPPPPPFLLSFPLFDMERNASPYIE